MKDVSESIVTERFWRERGKPALHPRLAEILSTAPAQLDACERLLLYTLVRTISPEVAVEIGTFQGGSAMILHAALESAGRGRLWCIDPRPQLKIDWSKIADRATMIVEPSPSAFQTVSAQIPAPIDFVFIDGNHSYENVFNDTHEVVKHLAGQAWLLYHDAFHHDVRRAIDECVATIPGLNNGGEVCRYFNNTQWPRTVMGGLRLLHFRDPKRKHWLPESYSHPSPKVGASQLSQSLEATVRDTLRGLVAQKKTPIALYGIGPVFAGISAVAAEFSDSIAGVLEDDALTHGSERLGWPILHPLECLALGTRSIVVTLPSGRVAAAQVPELEAEGLTVVDLPESARLSDVRTPCGRGPDDPLSPIIAKMDHLLLEGARRFAIYGAGAFARRVGIWMAQSPTNFLLTAVLDDDRAKIGKRMWGAPILSPKDIGNARLKPEALFLCSPKNEAQLKQRCAVAESLGIPIISCFPDR